jgi:hypothetical protein
MTNMIDVNAPALQARVTNILKDPKREWPVIAAEPTTTEKLYSSYIAPLAAIPAIATFIGYSIVGLSLPFVGTVRIGIIRGLVSAFVSYVVSLVLVYVAAMVIDWLAQKFESTPNQIQALKLVAYSYTAVWVAGVVMVIPALVMLGVLGGLYSIYLFYVGLPVMMKTPESQVVPYMAVSAVSVIVMGIILAMMTAAVTGMPWTVYS